MQGMMLVIIVAVTGSLVRGEDSQTASSERKRTVMAQADRHSARS